ncbi:hypothetical protein DXG01_004571 [Tephrocybe rancida]|nr:hypothetical protein DXG01_004571 [Tephrocybe rancida]
MRPVYPLTKTRTVPDHIALPDYAIDGRPASEAKRAGQPPRSLRPEEQDKMRTACRLGREVLDIAASHIRPGITTDELDEIVHRATIERNAYPSPLNYRNFPKSVCTSVNEVVCHGIPDQRKLRDGDIINIDVSLYFEGEKDFSSLQNTSDESHLAGYHADLNATYPVGETDEDSKKLIRTARSCLDESIKICKPGALIRDIGKVMYVLRTRSRMGSWSNINMTSEPIARANGCASIRTYTGHGINDLFHDSGPNIPHYAKNKAVGTMKPGMVGNLGYRLPSEIDCSTFQVFTIEPVRYIP